MPGRYCGWCSSPHRATWERRIIEGESIRSVAADTPFSESAAKRHLSRHAPAAALEAVRVHPVEGLHPSDFATRLLSLADEAAVLRASVQNPTVKLRAMREEASILAELMGRLGLTSAAVADSLSEAKALAQGISRVLSDEPQLARQLAGHFSAAAEHDLAAAFSRLADAADSRLASLPSHVATPPRREIAS